MGEAAIKDRMLEEALKAQAQGQQVTLPPNKAVAIIALQRTVSGLEMDATVAEKLGETEAAKAMASAAEHLGKAAARIIGEAQKVIVPVSQLVVPG